MQDTTDSDRGLEGAFLGWDLYTPTVWLWSFKKRKPVRMHDPVFFKSKFPFSDPTVLLNKDFTKQEVQQMHSADNYAASDTDGIVGDATVGDVTVGDATGRDATGRDATGQDATG